MKLADLMKLGRSIVRALLVATLLLGAVPQLAHAQLPTVTPVSTVDPAYATPDPSAVAQPAFAPGELLIGVRVGPTAAGADVGAAAFAGVDALSAVVSASDAEVAQAIDTTGPADSQVTYLLNTEPGQEYAVANALLGQPGVIYVEPNWYVSVAQEPAAASPEGTNSIALSPGFAVNDPLYAANQWNMQRINAARAWQMLYTQNLFAAPAEVTVAVLDTGIDTTHPDFAGRLAPGYNYIPEPGPDKQPGTADDIINPPMRDGFGHGTHVAGILAAGLNDGVGVAGVAPQIRIAPYRVLGDTGGGTIADVAAGIISATVDGAQIINMSLTTTSPSTTIQNAVQYAAAQGVLLLAAAGNGYTSQVYWPAAYPEVVAVAALDYSDVHAVYSNYGPQVEISAPGGDLTTRKVFSTWSSDAIDRCATPVYSNGAPYCTRSGTSQATPAVAGAAALLWSLDPTLTAADIRALLRDSADPLLEPSQYVGAGKLNVANALRELLPSTVNFQPTSALTEVQAAALPMTLTVQLQNPSLEAIDWKAALNVPLAAAITPTATQGAWITMTSGIENVQVGTIAYGSPDYVTLLISPTEAISGTFSASIDVTGTRGDGTTVPNTLPINIFIHTDAATPSTQPTPVAPVPPLAPTQPKYFLPVIRGGSAPTDTIDVGSLAWIKPADESARTSYALTDTSVVTVALPAGVKLGTETYSMARIYADGFVALAKTSAGLAASPILNPAANRCIPSLGYPAQGVFGWWADLDPGADGARVSSFATDDGRLVIEYADVPAISAAQPYTVSFQIVLRKDGGVGLNYAETPAFSGRPANVTVGVEGQDALMYSNFGCVTPAQTLGSLPRSGESYLIKAADIY